MLLYHVSTDLNHNGFFQPAIPRCLSIAEDDVATFMEDNTKKRVCASATVEGCFSSMPDGGKFFERMNLNQNGYYKLFAIDTDKLGIRKEHIIDGKNLYDKGMVFDAHLTEEHWILESFQVSEEDTMIISPYYWKTDIIKLNRFPFMSKWGYVELEKDFDEIHMIKQLRFFIDNGKSHLDFYPGDKKDRSSIKDVVFGEWENYRTDMIERLKAIRNETMERKAV